ncbi:MAG: hypothetical protein LBC03_00800 [Nitrososphaerota archaeon]|nr:hypothetical protein [Nitrososphaerota archaeon]
MSDNNTNKKTINSQANPVALSEAANTEQIKKITNQHKGNYGEMTVDRDKKTNEDKDNILLDSNKVTSLTDKGHRGIDGVYKKETKVGDKEHNPYDRLNDIFGVKVIKNEDLVSKTYDIVEAKYGSSQLGNTKDGKQMSQEWIDKRLGDAVGKDGAGQKKGENTADAIRLQHYYAPETVSAQLARINKDGTVKYSAIDNKNKEPATNKNVVRDSQNSRVETFRQKVAPKQSGSSALQTNRSNNTEIKDYRNKVNVQSLNALKTSPSTTSKETNTGNTNSNGRSSSGQTSGSSKGR